jgi:hypothetical protein
MVEMMNVCYLQTDRSVYRKAARRLPTSPTDGDHVDKFTRTLVAIVVPGDLIQTKVGRFLFQPGGYDIQLARP